MTPSPGLLHDDRLDFHRKLRSDPDGLETNGDERSHFASDQNPRQQFEVEEMIAHGQRNVLGEKPSENTQRIDRTFDGASS
jgi:hypothetical protein